MKDLVILFTSFFKIGILTFGGGYAMLPMLEREIVTKHKWSTMEEIMDYFAIGQCTPGIIAVNTATFIGYKKKGIIGGIIATLGVITPSIIIISLLAGLIDMVSDNEYVNHAFAGVAVAVCALLLQAIMKLSTSGVKDIFTFIIAVLAFGLSLFLKLSPIIIVIISGVAAVIYKAITEKKRQAVYSSQDSQSTRTTDSDKKEEK